MVLHWLGRSGIRPSLKPDIPASEPLRSGFIIGFIRRSLKHMVIPIGFLIRSSYSSPKGRWLKKLKKIYKFVKSQSPLSI